MIRKFLAISVFSLFYAHSSHAEESKHPFRIGFGGDIGLPSGAALGVVVHPKVDWLSAEASVTYNAIALGGRLSLKVDPVAFAPKLPIGVFIDPQFGFALQGPIPGHTDLPRIGYNYINLYGGIRIGKPNNFHWDIEAGPTYLHMTTGNIQSVMGNVTGLTFGSPSVNGWIVPTFSTGFSVVWP